MQRKTAAFRSVGDFLVFVHTEDPPSDEEWDQLMTAFKQVPDLRRCRVLVLTAGGAPNARQRQVVNAILKQATPPVAIVSSSMVARAVVTAMGWFNPRMKAFAEEDISGAFAHLDATEVDRGRLSQAVNELRRELGYPSIRARISQRPPSR
jgi:hypothetical protein